MKAMQKDPAKRYQSAAEMLYDIDEFKRNPSIHFEYKYFVDETPTRFVEAITRVKGETVEEEEEAPEEETPKKKGPAGHSDPCSGSGSFRFGGLAAYGRGFHAGCGRTQ